MSLKSGLVRNPFRTLSVLAIEMLLSGWQMSCVPNGPRSISESGHHFSLARRPMRYDHFRSGTLEPARLSLCSSIATYRRNANNVLTNNRDSAVGLNQPSDEEHFMADVMKTSCE
jgi:hypothetical protein